MTVEAALRQIVEVGGLPVEQSQVRRRRGAEPLDGLRGDVQGRVGLDLPEQPRQEQAGAHADLDDAARSQNTI